MPSSDGRWENALAGRRMAPLFINTFTNGNVSTTAIRTLNAGKSKRCPRPVGILIVGFFGAFGRTWLASVTFDPEGNHDVNVFHEARQIGGYHPKLTTVAFIPWYMATLTPPASDAAPRAATPLLSAVGGRRQDRCGEYAGYSRCGRAVSPRNGPAGAPCRR